METVKISEKIKYEGVGVWGCFGKLGKMFGAILETIVIVYRDSLGLGNIFNEAS